MACNNTIEHRLLALGEEGYRDFQRRLMPTVEPASVIGVRTPLVRSLARELASTPEAARFMAALPHRYYEENNLHAYLVERERDYAACVAALDAFLPYVDNWATCDTMKPPVFKRHLDELYEKTLEWLASGRTYTARYAVGVMMTYYLDGPRSGECMDAVSRLEGGDYYVDMMCAWFFATALAKRFGEAAPYLEKGRLPEWTRLKAIQKGVESRRVSDAQKILLRSLRAG